MDDQQPWMLTERAKELECIYAVDAVLQNKDLSALQVMEQLTRAIPLGFASPEACRIRITLDGYACAGPDFDRADILYRTPLGIDAQEAGHIEMGYIPDLLGQTQGVLLESEVRLLDTIAGHIARFVFDSQRRIAILLDMMQRIDPDMLLRICERLRLHLQGLAGRRREEGMEGLLRDIQSDATPLYGETNAPLAQPDRGEVQALVRTLIAGATRLMSDAEVFDALNRWIQQERAFTLVKTVGRRDAGISDILDALREYTGVMGQGEHPQGTTETWLVAELAHRFLTEDEHLLNRVLDTLQIPDFQPLLEKNIGSPASRGHIGGKGAGLFIAQQVLAQAAGEEPLLADIRTPRTWYIAADHLADFLRYNHLEELNAYKYNGIEHLRMTYAGVVAKVQHARLPLYTTKMLSLLLDSLPDTPIIVRSSSLLEDSANAAFSGKYKSLFLPNQGAKAQRLQQLTDAVLEVYASMYNPDSIQYRRERGLLHFTERMGILIQEVVGRRAGPYFLPLYAGVAFSENPLRWSPRITREGGLARMVMGLGTRAVDRVNDDYPLLFSPGQPGLRVNQSPADARHYSQKYIDLINLETQAFETVEARDFLQAWGGHIPEIGRMVSVFTPTQMQSKNDYALDFQRDEMVITFEGLLSGSRLPATLSRMLTTLSRRMGVPVDIEFAHDGQHLYLLQCRSQSRGSALAPAPIPQQLPPGDILFTANRFIPNGRLEGIGHIVYVDAEAYAALPTREAMLEVGRAVGRLCALLPRRKYILIGPGRWGSRGDIQLGVRVTYSDICNTAALIEVAREKRGLVPELSFGTHFFQDLTEADILYLPLYPDQPGAVFRESFFRRARNLLGEALPEYAHLDEVLKVIDVGQNAGGRTLSLYMNADLERAIAFFTHEAPNREQPPRPSPQPQAPEPDGEGAYWRWRHYMAEQIARDMDMQAYGVEGIYLFGSTNTGQAGMGSDIDLLIHCNGDEGQRRLLRQWLEGWSRALARINYLKTGYEADGLLDVHLVNDEDIRNNDPFAMKIHSVTDPATPLRTQ